MDFIRSKFSGYQWELVKHRDVRSVYKLTQGKNSLYIKIYHPTTIFQQLRNMIYPRTLKEARMLLRLADSGIMVPKVIDHIRHGFTSALVTRAIDPCKHLYDIRIEDQARIILDITKTLMENGFYYKDLHAGNIILDDTNNAFLVDAYEVVPRRRVKERDVINMFALVLGIYDVSNQLLGDYIHILLPQVDPKGIIKAIRKKAFFSTRQLVKRYVKRSLAPGSFSEFISTHEYDALIPRDSKIDLDKIIQTHRENIKNGNNILKYQDKTQVSLAGDYCVKWYKKIHKVTRPYAIRAWCGLLTLYFNGIHVPAPVAAVVFKDRSSLLITQGLSLPNLDRLLYHEYESMSLKHKIELSRRFGMLVGRMHSRNIYHADMKACNIMVANDTVDFFILDTDRVTQLRHMSDKRRLKNLVQINTSIPRHVSSGLRMAFMVAYTNITGGNPKDFFKEVWALSKMEDIVYTTNLGDKIESWD
ncbi:MAG: hypothetical protein J7L53_04940 [Deltaproteobacteria bacterium]|nr:hypothetical protein [Deltaproteobacteria bacterium]